MKMICKLYDLYSNSFTIYTKPIYTKYNGVYGYITISHPKVYFFWVNGENLVFDDVSDKFKVEYTSDK